MTAHCSWAGRPGPTTFPPTTADGARASGRRDRKSTRLNSSHSQISYAVSLDQKSTRLKSSHSQISYAVFCLKKKKEEQTTKGSSKLGGRTMPCKDVSALAPWMRACTERDLAK